MSSLLRQPLRVRATSATASGAVGLLVTTAAFAGPAAPPSASAPAEAMHLEAEERPFRLHEAVGLSWLRFGLEHRSRVEHLDNDLRSVNPGDATAFSMRTLLQAEARYRHLVVGGELADARLRASASTPLNTGLGDAFDILQAYVGLRGKDVLGHGDRVAFNAGRMTLDLGSRRLVARNEFRNTINAFTGFHAEWRSPANDVVRAFVVRPVIRLPSDPAGLAEDRIELDPENVDALLWGAFYQSRPLARGLTLEAYALGLHERDGSLAPSANRELITPGARLLLPPARGAFDVQVELMGQLGRSRATTAAKDTTDLEHLAFSVHASVGHRFATRWSPRLVLQFDHASGDRSPNDGINGRFDPLFGARRWEFGPTGLYGAIPRSNVTTPGLRVEVEPHRKVDTFIAYRPVWLAAARDAWTSAGLRDTSGAAGTFVGHQLEGRVRWHIFPKNLVLDVGGAVFVRGEFAREAPGGESAPSLYAYSQVTGTM